MTSAILPKYSPMPGGFQVGALAGPSKLADIFTMPDGSNSAWVQADADIQFHMDGDPLITVGLVLPAKTFLALTNITEIDQLVLIGTATISIQFATGDIGPIPPPPLVRTTGGGGGGSGTVTSVNVSGGDTGLGTTGGPITSSGTIVLTGRAKVLTDDTAHVMIGGDDATGIVGRLDRPFATLAAAAAAMSPNQTMYVWPGTYEANGIIPPKNTTIKLLGATIARTHVGGPLFVVDADNVLHIDGCGNSSLIHAAGGAPIVEAGTASTLHIAVGSLYNEDAALCTGAGSGATLKVEAASMRSGNTDVAFSGWDDVQVSGALTCGLAAYAIASGESVTHRGTITAHELAIEVNNGDLTVYGDVIVNGTIDGAAINSIGLTNIKVYGNIRATGSDCAAVKVQDGGGRIEVYGSVSAETTAAIYAPAIDVDSTIIVYGNIHCDQRHGVYSHSADVSVYGDITSDGAITDANGVHAVGPCRVMVYGNITSAAGAGAKTSHDDAEIEIYGNSHSSGRWGIFCISGGHIIIHGVASSGIREGAYMEVGRLTILGGARSANGTVAVDILSQQSHPGNLLTLGGAARLESSAGAFYTIDCEPGGIDGVRSYGASGNMGVRSGLVVVGTYNVIP